MLKPINELKTQTRYANLAKTISAYLGLANVEAELTSKLESEIKLHTHPDLQKLSDRDEPLKDAIVFDADHRMNHPELVGLVDVVPDLENDDLRNISQISDLKTLIRNRPARALDSVSYWVNDSQVGDHNVVNSHGYFPQLLAMPVFGTTIKDLLINDLNAAGYDYTLSPTDDVSFVAPEIFHSNLSNDEQHMTLRVPINQFL